MTKAFISYSWDSDDHKAWVRALATRLRHDGIEVTLDQWHLAPGDQLPEFMERAVRESDYVLVVCTRRYKQRSEGRQGGVGYEGDIITAEVMTTWNQRKFIPIRRETPWRESAPSWMLGKYHIDLCDTPFSEAQYQDLLNTLCGARPQAPPVGSSELERGATPGCAPTSPRVPDSGLEPIRFKGVIVDQVGSPRDDGTPGSALYRVPFRLSRRPPKEWAELFVRFWDHPPRYTTMHRPGIASVVGDKVVLDGTTVEEVERYHRDTLVLAAQEANREYVESMKRRRAAEERDRKSELDHRRQVEDISKRIGFEDE